MKNKLFSLLVLFSLTPMLILAHGYGWNQGWGGHMGMGFMGGGWMMIIWIIVLALIVGSIIKWLLGVRSNPAATSNALVILSERYARGEISQEEFETMKKALK